MLAFEQGVFYSEKRFLIHFFVLFHLTNEASISTCASGPSYGHSYGPWWESKSWNRMESKNSNAFTGNQYNLKETRNLYISYTVDDYTDLEKLFFV